MGATCEIELKSGKICEIPAIGRCIFCERAFCTSHQAYTWQSVGYVDVCAPCFPKTSEGIGKQAEQERFEAEEYFRSGAARTALLTSRVPSVDIFAIGRKWKTGLFGGRYVDVTTLIGRGWILGEFRWEYDRNMVGDRDMVTENCLTALRDVSLDELDREEGYYSRGFTRVRPCSGGYERLKTRNDSFGMYNWIEAAQAVRRLVGP